jgi:hypothetical protein
MSGVNYLEALGGVFKWQTFGCETEIETDKTSAKPEETFDFKYKLLLSNLPNNWIKKDKLRENILLILKSNNLDGKIFDFDNKVDKNGVCPDNLVIASGLEYNEAIEIGDKWEEDFDCILKIKEDK